MLEEEDLENLHFNCSLETREADAIEFHNCLFEKCDLSIFYRFCDCRLLEVDFFHTPLKGIDFYPVSWRVYC
jgi:hypothetical protein